ncbi:carbohydrate sulfotransferase 11-like [Mizuhopecten yessoensis]|uniref:carbohydrate sulfotransferase 11-like n=1 Tax=Mizuhopecten yessoensis TaxID=6573 RepID=UPI000B45F3C2|nr:carbohydrate sulfotransferase 11-like [Mizuhopecten yessoensis]
MNKRQFFVSLIVSGVLGLVMCWFLISYPGRLNNVKEYMTEKRFKYFVDNMRRPDASQIYRDRITDLYESCATVTMRRVTGRTPRFFFAKTNNIAFCKTPKSGSTFIGTLVSALEYKGELGNMFHVNRERVHGRNEMDFSTLLNHKSDSTKIVLVTRNPYTRLFSAFIDKYFLLGAWGKGLARVKDKGRYKMGNGYCGYNVSFQDVLDYIATKGTVDAHTLPVTSLCNPCTVHYGILCKQETLTADIEHVMNVINITQSKRQAIMNMINGKSLNDTLFAWISSHLQYYKTYKIDCSDKILLMEKLWQALQLQGYISLTLSFPTREFKVRISS